MSMFGKNISTVFIADAQSAGTTTSYNFLDGTFTYVGYPVTKIFHHAFIDNQGTGDIRISFMEGLDLSSNINGAKTIKSGHDLSIHDNFDKLVIYYIGDSTVEIIIMSEVEDQEGSL